MLRTDFSEVYDRPIVVVPSSSFKPEEVIQFAKLAGAVINEGYTLYYLLRFEPSIMPEGSYTKDALNASALEFAAVIKEIPKYKGKRVRIENRFEEQNFAFVLIANVKEENGEVLTLVDIDVLRSTGTTQVDDMECKFVITEQTHIEILD